jgi:hypothetical protein
MADSGIDPIAFPKFLRGADNEFFFRVDNPADVIRNASGGIGGVRAPLKDDDVQLGPMTLCLGGGAHSRCIAADNNQSFLGHDFTPRSVDAGNNGPHAETFAV